MTQREDSSETSGQTLSVHFWDRQRRRWIVSVTFEERGFCRMEPTEVAIRSVGSRITREALKAIPFGAIINDARRLALKHSPATGTNGSLGARRGARRGRRLERDDLQTVTDAYLGAYQAGSPVVAAVADACGISRSAASKRIRAAKDSGLLVVAQ